MRESLDTAAYFAQLRVNQHLGPHHMYTVTVEPDRLLADISASHHRPSEDETIVDIAGLKARRVESSPCPYWEMSAEELAHYDRFRQASIRYPRRVAEAYGGDIGLAALASDAEVADRVADWEREHDVQPIPRTGAALSATLSA